MPVRINWGVMHLPCFYSFPLLLCVSKRQSKARIYIYVAELYAWNIECTNKRTNDIYAHSGFCMEVIDKAHCVVLGFRSDDKDNNIPNHTLVRLLSLSLCIMCSFRSVVCCVFRLCVASCSCWPLDDCIAGPYNMLCV